MSLSSNVTQPSKGPTFTMTYCSEMIILLQSLFLSTSPYRDDWRTEIILHSKPSKFRESERAESFIQWREFLQKMRSVVIFLPDIIIVIRRIIMPRLASSSSKSLLTPGLSDVPEKKIPRPLCCQMPEHVKIYNPSWRYISDFYQKSA